MIERFDRVFSKAMSYMGIYFSGMLILGMMFYVSAHVIARYAIPGVGGVTGTYSYVGALLPVMFYFALAYGWYKGSYVALDLLQKRLHGKVKWWFQFVFLVMTIVFFTTSLTIGAVLETKYAYDIHWLVGEPGYYMLGWPWKATMVVGCFFLIIRNILDLIRMIKTREVIDPNR
jgi:TRAP-type mannitol/chloroaromatic compound transport system permease small subunit